MSKNKIINSVVDSIKAWQDEETGAVNIDNGNINVFVKEITEDINRNYKECDIGKIDIELEKATEEYRLLKELNSEVSYSYLEGKIVAFQTIKKMLS